MVDQRSSPEGVRRQATPDDQDTVKPSDSMSESQASWEPSPRVAQLLFVDFDGMPSDPDEVISDGLDGGYRDRSEALRQVLRDSDEDPAGRFLACVALTRWGDAIGYEEVVAAAHSPGAVAWRGASYDRMHGEDDTFGVLADAVGDSIDMVDERGTGAERVRAAEALLGVVDSVQFDRHTNSLLREDLLVASLPVIKEAVARGTTRLKQERISYDLGLQLALTITAARRIDADWALNAARGLVAAKPGERGLEELREDFPEFR
ncbi:hypothetical protein [Streptomyces sp. Go-475]|uniref:hypothetical protein n=1 Tax=Streptomyces sp. Go-475 TaxID=2072505 RepID=UPI0013009FD9|nr:hypothetical protein [Streptomyces sp. Go-475]